ncbi:2-dehydropantoate 2-reductase [Alcaligenes sp. SORT26]|uniref:ketopantoate reductase family protein n=1 Tax=Alcaligenes sp. SORT26 TaxID=2813780 RepID=UPI001A9D64DA|nr:2-dehydropantoate 2-reductase [Alcaligenes sp. SORT26]QTC01150.1 2-dehydropantoate 2-reductase [Alcaligenes sp. SORT26]
MKICIGGGGAMGSLFAWQLWRSGAQVHIYDPWVEHVQAIQAQGLRVDYAQGQDRAMISASTDAGEIGPCDVLMIFGKFHQTEALIQACQPVLRPDTLILTLQNGLGNIEILKTANPRHRLAFGLTTLTSELHGPGHIESSYSGMGETFFWPLDGQISSIETRLGHLLSSPIGTMSLDAQIELRIWKKLVINCCLNTVCALANSNVAQVASTEGVWQLFENIISEIVTLAAMKKIPLTRDMALSYLSQVCEDAADHFPSMVMDIRRGKRTEIDCLNGAIVQQLKTRGIPAPCNETVTSLINVLEARA